MLRGNAKPSVARAGLEAELGVLAQASGPDLYGRRSVLRLPFIFGGKRFGAAGTQSSGAKRRRENDLAYAPAIAGEER